MQVMASSKNILVMGGTRFIGVFLSRLLVKEGHQVDSFPNFIVTVCFGTIMYLISDVFKQLKLKSFLHEDFIRFGVYLRTYIYELK
jgi:nucleoside-diphosphate-sugar epimerase